ncbi:MAG: membrane protein insertase YidC [Deltaproteobacteria bacterium]|nr:membrane protein insertase YidC [Deltaproteobacteria bacterium]
MSEIIAVWNTVLLEPMLNFLVVLTSYLFSNFGLAIIALTIFVRIIMLPLTAKQMRSMKAMQEMQPRLKEMQQKYGKDKSRFAQEQMRLYRESGVSPLSGCLPMILQLPIWIALYQSIIQGLSVTPEGLLGLSQHLYSWQLVQGMVPLNSEFLWLDLARPDIFMAILVAGSMFAVQKMTAMPTMDPSKQSMGQMMTLMMPLFLGFLALSFPSGLSLYWVLSNLISIVLQYRSTGWGGLRGMSLRPRLPQMGPRPAPYPPAAERKEDTLAVYDSDSQQVDDASAESERRRGARALLEQKRISDGRHRSKRKLRGRSRRPRS